jgi:DNA-directed RNA polymerase specialized sigma24 family protein
MAQPLEEEVGGLSSLAARVASSGSATDNRTDAAMRTLFPVIERLAARIIATSNGHAQWIASDFVSESPAFVFEALRSGNYDAARGTFKAWCHDVLRNRFVSELRKQKRHTSVSLDAPVLDDTDGTRDVAGAGPNPVDTLAAQSYRHEPFSVADLRKIERWPVRSRILLMSLALLWTRVPSEKWARWCAECRIIDSFPPADFVDRSSEDCHEIVADALGINLNNLYQLKSRTAERLLALDPQAPVIKYICDRLRNKKRESSGDTT